MYMYIYIYIYILNSSTTKISFINKRNKHFTINQSIETSRSYAFYVAFQVNNKYSNVSTIQLEKMAAADELPDRLIKDLTEAVLLNTKIF